MKNLRFLASNIQSTKYNLHKPLCTKQDTKRNHLRLSGRRRAIGDNTYNEDKVKYDKDKGKF